MTIWSPRNLSELELSYLEELDLYEKVLNFTSLISINQHGIETNGRGVRAVKIFTRQCLAGLSLSRILPKPIVSISKDEELWDISSIASLTRNIMEGYLSLYFFGIENVTESEAELRFFILQLHRNVEWYNITKLENPNDPELKQFEEGIPGQKIRIMSHNYLSNLTKNQKKKVKEGSEMYYTKYDFENKLLICKDLRKYYRLLSNLVHPLPFSIERIDDVRGRGLGSEPDIAYSQMCLMLARRFMAASTIGIVDHFPNELANRFSKELELIRPLENTGFIN